MTNILFTPAARLGVLIAIAGAALLTVFALVLHGWVSEAETEAFIAPILAQDLRFWVQIVTGLGAYMISAWLWALRPSDPDLTLFALSGLCTLVFTFSMAPPGGVGVHLPMSLLDPLYRINGAGASLFGIVMTVLLLRYPVRLPGHGGLSLIAVLGFGGWTVLALAGPLEGLMVIHSITFLEMLCMCAAVIAQYIVTRNRPKDRALAIWLGISIIIGSGIFIALVAAPIALGFPPFVDERYAFSSFLLVYVGLAIGLTRYRLFELGEWAFYVLFYVSAALLLIALDIALVFALSLDASASLGVSLLVVALIYLPSRDLLWRRFLQRKPMEEHTLIQSVIDVAFEASSETRAQKWKHLFQTLYEPLEIRSTGHGGSEVAIADDGASLFVPATTDIPAMVLQHPWRGRGLFGPRHKRSADHLVDIMRRAEQGRRAYDLGAAEERTRIARDMHDNIGSQLLSALHSPVAGRKDMMIGQALSDLRDIIRNANRPGLPAGEALADLRAETAERFAATGIDLSWSVTGDETISLAPETALALRSLIREGVSNIIRHATARSARIDVACDADHLAIEIGNDGPGFDMARLEDGTGLRSMRERLSGLGGSFELHSDPRFDGTTLLARLTLGTGTSGREAAE